MFLAALAVPCIALGQASTPPDLLDYTVDAHGLTMRCRGIPIVKGSWFQVYAPGWTKGYFSSIYHDPKIKRIDANTVQLTYDSDDAKTHAVETYTLSGSHLKAHYEFNWASAEPASVEMTPGLLWAPALEGGTLLADGKPTRSLLPKPYGSQDEDLRRFSPDASTYTLSLPFGALTIQSSQPLTLFDGRDHFDEDWARGRELFWLGTDGIELKQGKTSTMDVEWALSAPTITAQPIHQPAARPTPSEKFIPQRATSAYQSPNSLPVLIPRPRTNRLDFDHPIAVTGAWSFPAGRFRGFDDFWNALQRRFAFPPKANLAANSPIKIDAGVSRLHLTPGAYRITIRPSAISVVGEEEEGLQDGLSRLAQLAYIRDGKVMLPTGYLYDEPYTTWRGVHLFVGPQSPEFHKKLWERVLLPLGFNKVVLQCERTRWNSLPGIETSETMSREDLAKLFAMYRGFDVEPIPLLESLGHDEWIFANGKNLDVAMEPQNPHALDPTKPRTRELLNQLWDEVFDLLQPSTVHFGLDEIDLRGFPTDPALKTKLWATHIPFLASIAKRHKARMILWGDQLLAPGEAPDAEFGDTASDARARRAAVPDGAMVADWHYKPDSNPEIFRRSLTVLSSSGLTPIASTWYRPENIRGFDLAAIAGGYGTLQTTWAGYTSSEEAMIENFNQFSAMVLAADFSWSGRQDELGDLGYDPAEVFKSMYFGRPQSAAPIAGTEFGLAGGNPIRIGSTEFRVASPLKLRNLISPDESSNPERFSLNLNVPAKSIAFALDTATHLDDGEKVGEISIDLADGRTKVQPLVYGRHVRAAGDDGTCIFADRAQGLCSITVDLGSRPTQIRSVTLTETSLHAGLRLYGVTAY